ncbi:ABC transporter substrate-binding protein [Haloplanus sp. GCM10025708]|uniref:ABC transporter substrate-binding protein n=1 Tax=Haloferacaceae TaxID=1644056 RepID=UPI0036192B6E
MTGFAGCVGGVGDGSGGAIKIGLQADLTGALSIYGFWHRRVLENYVDHLNANGGIGGDDVELLVEDTETDAKVGGQVFRKLVQQDDVDFVIGSQSSGVSIATNPLADQFEIPYFPLGEAPSITGADGNRWVVRNNHSTEHAAQIAVEHGMDSGSKWTIVYQDYAFGQQYRDAVKAGVEQRGGEVLSSIGVPVGESDLTSYLNKVPDDTEVLFNALIGASSLNFLQQSSDLGTPGERLGAIASVEGVDISSIGGGAEGAEYVTMLPRNPGEHETEGTRHLREMANPSETDNVYLGGHINASYEALSWIRDAVSATDWAGASDHQALIEWFESGPAVEGGTKYPQGPKFFRGEDHQAFMNMFIERIDGGALTKLKEVVVDEPSFEPRADLKGQSF